MRMTAKRMEGRMGSWTAADIRRSDRKAQVQVSERARSGGKFAPEAIQYSNDLGDKPTLIWADKRRCYVDPRYQRPITEQGRKNIKRMVANFRWDRLTPIRTGPENEKGYPIIDGQHEWEAAMLHPLVTEIPLLVTTANTVEQQAEIISEVNSYRINFTNVNVFWADVAAKHPEALHLYEVCTRAGLSIGKTATGNQPQKTTVALGTIKKLLNKIGEPSVVHALKALADAQPTAVGIFQAPVVEAVTRFIATYWDAYDPERLVAVLKRLNIHDALRQARAFKAAMGGTVDTAFRLLLVRAYNHKLQKKLPTHAGQKGARYDAGQMELLDTDTGIDTE